MITDSGTEPRRPQSDHQREKERGVGVERERGERKRERGNRKREEGQKDRQRENDRERGKEKEREWMGWMREMNN